VQLAELQELRTERARTSERMQTLEVRTQELENELASRAVRIDELESRLAEPASTGEQAEAEPAERTYDDDHHVLLVPSETGYMTLERPGPAPQPGDTVGLPIGRYKVSRRGASPFPADSRGCAYLIQA
jgi:hypothetical protein